MTVAELKELVKNWPDDAVVANWKDCSNRNNSEIEEIDYLFTVTEETLDGNKKYMIFG